MDLKKLNSAVDSKLTKMAAGIRIGQVLGNLEARAKMLSLNIVEASKYYFVVKAPYPKQLEQFAKEAKSTKGVVKVQQNPGSVICVLDEDLLP